MKKIHKICSAALCLFLICGCAGQEQKAKNHAESVSDVQFSGVLSIFAGQEYKASLDRLFASFSLTYPDLELRWVQTADTADILITDRLPKSEYDDFLALNDIIVDFEGIFPETFVLQEGNRVIGLPLFLNLDGIWYDELIYRRNEISVPTTLSDLLSTPLRDEYPAISISDSEDTLFWSTLAPLYLANGGSCEELSTGRFNGAVMEKSLSRIQEIKQKGLLFYDSAASDLFMRDSTLFWAAKLSDAASIAGGMSSNSHISFMPSLIFLNEETPVTVLRSSTLSVKKGSNIKSVTVFLRGLFHEKNLINLSSHQKIPLACKISYGSHSLSGFAKTVYSVLSSPAAELYEVTCMWEEERTLAIFGALHEYFCDQANLSETVHALCG